MWSVITSLSFVVEHLSLINFIICSVRHKSWQDTQWHTWPDYSHAQSWQHQCGNQYKGSFVVLTLAYFVFFDYKEHPADGLFHILTLNLIVVDNVNVIIPQSTRVNQFWLQTRQFTETTWTIAVPEDGTDKTKEVTEEKKKKIPRPNQSHWWQWKIHGVEIHNYFQI